MSAPRQLAVGEAPSNGTPPIRSANLAAEELREDHEQRAYMLIGVGSTWTSGSGN
jgi:hypothetical protein